MAYDAKPVTLGSRALLASNPRAPASYCTLITWFPISFRFACISSFAVFFCGAGAGACEIGRGC